MERGPGLTRRTTMTTLTFRGHQYEPRTGLAPKSQETLTYRRAVYHARQVEAAADSAALCLPEGFIRSSKTAALIGVEMQPCSQRQLIYRGIQYIK